MSSSSQPPLPLSSQPIDLTRSSPPPANSSDGEVQLVFRSSTSTPAGPTPKPKKSRVLPWNDAGESSAAESKGKGKARANEGGGSDVEILTPLKASGSGPAPSQSSTYTPTSSAGNLRSEVLYPPSGRESNYGFEYARSNRASCKARGACSGSKIPKDSLKFAVLGAGWQGEPGLMWRHWGCISLAELRALQGCRLDHVPGFRSLKEEDQARVRAAVQAGRLRDSDLSPGARLPPDLSSFPPASPTPTQTPTRKRPAPTSSPAGPSSTPVEEPSDSQEQEPEPEEVLYVSMRTDVVGVQYYRGLVDFGELVSLVREPRNAYDPNAIRVDNIRGVQVGHVPRNIASRLAPLLDKNIVTAEGTMNSSNVSGRGGGGNTYKLAMTLSIFGRAAWRERLEPLLVWATPGQRGFAAMRAANQTSVSDTSSSSPQKKGKGKAASSSLAVGPSGNARTTVPDAEMRRVLDGLDKVKRDESGEGLLDALCNEVDLLKLPVHPDPPGRANGLLRSELLRHQSQGLAWMERAENPIRPRTPKDAQVQFWVKKANGPGQTYFYNFATKTPQAEAPVLGRGGLLSDGMGLGKTLSILALAVHTAREDVGEGYSSATLVVCPLSVVSNWETQIKEHVSAPEFSYHVYHGDGRKVSPAALAKNTAVITTYQTVASDWASSSTASGSSVKKARPNPKGLFGIKWKRIVLDEGHVIRNAKSKLSQACVALDAERRWVCTGTPIINSPKDLGTFLSFLRICRPLDDPEMFKRVLMRPLGAGDAGGARVLKSLMTSVCIRRTKEMKAPDGEPIVKLPSIDFYSAKVMLTPDERARYDEVAAESKRRFLDLQQGSESATTTYSNVLALLTRLRQLALHPDLVPKDYLEELRENAKKRGGPAKQVDAVDSDEIRKLQTRLKQAMDDAEECPVCMVEPMEDPVILTCNHPFCRACILTVIYKQAKCPMDRGAISQTSIIEPAPIIEEADADADVQESGEGDALRAPPKSSAKIDALLEILKAVPKGDKVLVFSQFTSFLAKIAPHLDAAGLSHVTFDGSVPVKRRDAIIKRFNEPVPVDDDAAMGGQPTKGPPRIMLISLKCGALGLNLTAANHVVMVDPWWQMSILSSGLSLHRDTDIRRRVHSSIEAQAIDRTYRIGQQKSVKVFTLTTEDTVEAKVLEIQARKNALIQQAFSGIKSSKEDRRQAKETRIAELRELFGVAGR